MYERILYRIVIHRTHGLCIDDLFVGMEVVSEVKLGYCSPLQLGKNN